jgi:hypothetical protein
MRKREWMQLIAFAGVLFHTAFGSGYAIAEPNDAPPTIALCDVLAHPADYAGKTIALTVHITSTKEGSFLWSSRCRNHVLKLQIEDQARSNKGVQDLLEMLRQYGLSDRPVTATLIGVFLYSNQDGDGSRRRSVFRVRSATEIKQAEPKSAKMSPANTLSHESGQIDPPRPRAAPSWCRRRAAPQAPS